MEHLKHYSAFLPSNLNHDLNDLDWNLFFKAKMKSWPVFSIFREQISALVRLVPLSLCSASSLYTGVTEFEYLAQPISSLWFTFCLSLNKQDTLTGRSELGMQAVSASIIALLSFVAQPLSYLACIPSQGRNSHFFVSIIISPSHLVPPFTLSDVLSSSIFISLCSSSHVEMKKSSDDCGTCVGGEHSKVCVWGGKGGICGTF